LKACDLLTAVVCSGLLSASQFASAQAYGDAAGRAEHVSYGVADVLRVDPLYERVRQSRPREECIDEPVTRARRQSSAGGAVVGALVGGVLGSNVGSGGGRRAATAAGAMIGGVVGSNAQRSRQGGDVAYQGVDTRCRVVEVVSERRQLVAYDVEYRYRGELYRSRLDYDPGARLRVRVGITPAR